jgi:hypothetical protein
MVFVVKGVHFSKHRGKNDNKIVARFTNVRNCTTNVEAWLRIRTSVSALICEICGKQNVQNFLPQITQTGADEYAKKIHHKLQREYKSRRVK